MTIKGIPIILLSKIQTGVDGFNKPVYDESVEEVVDNVLVSPTSSTDIPDMLDLDRTKVTYTLAIPKGDVHEWFGHKVKFFGQTWKVCTHPIEGIEELIPGNWNRKVVVERYE